MNLEELKDFFGDRLTTSKSVRLEHSHDESWHIPKNIPDAVKIVVISVLSFL